MEAELVCFDGQIGRIEELDFPRLNRAFYFSDGFFESILFIHSEAKLWHFHRERIEQAASYYDFNLSEKLDTIYSDCKKLVESKNQKESNQRIKIVFFRKGKGKYTPPSDECSILIESQSLENEPKQSLSLGFSARAYVAPTDQGIKTLSASNYVLASREREKSSFDELVLLTNTGMVSECCSNNIWWFIQGQLYTSKLETGCVNGVFRRYLLAVLKHDLLIKETFINKEELKAVDEIFITNAVSGVQSVSFLESEKYSIKTTLELISYLSR